MDCIVALELMAWSIGMKLRAFEMERWQSVWENKVEYNLSESGVHPLRLNELIGPDASDELLTHHLGYSQSNGTEELRKKLSALYPGTDIDNFIVTNGSSEANFVTMWSFLESGSEVAIMLPNYMQVWGLAKTFQAKVKPFRLREMNGEWKPDIAALRKTVSKKTRLITICNPNNPTGAVMREDTLDEICEIARKVGAWILADEVYQGAEVDGRTTPTIWGRYERVVVNNGLSKAYGLPGLRIGWIVTTKNQAAKLWRYRDYTTIGPTALGDYLARKALQPEMRTKILARTRGILQKNLPIITNWIREHGENFSLVPPKAGAIVYPRYNLKVNSTHLAERVLKEKSTLIEPGDHFGMDGYLRIGYGLPEDYLREGLKRVDEVIQDIRKS
jgi:aspartate/methionine/tyrosine aminotransferase